MISFDASGKKYAAIKVPKLVIVGYYAVTNAKMDVDVMSRYRVRSKRELAVKVSLTALKNVGNKSKSVEC